MLPAPADHALEVLVGELADGGDAARSLDAGQGGGLALLLLAGHVMAQGDFGAQFLGGLAYGGEDEIRVAVDFPLRGVKRRRETSLDVLHLNID
ncbi:MAG: hypothetical protein LT106_16545 [Burkholderiaceae bacterium]|nr:hypothetical protein [Burkholderiaceae bacterium]